ncbi:MAG: hypothetical protein JXR83_13420 [Deltaproteobacteria bacterium]|nr:hypothetical protein [Deltaproteobacteria bacterium]
MAAQTQTSHLSVGGLTLALHHDRGFRLDLDRAMSRFAVAPAAADMDLAVHLCEELAEPPGRLRFDSGATWRLYGEGSTLHLRLGRPGAATPPHAVLHLDEGGAHGRLEIARWRAAADGAVYALEYPVAELLWLFRLARCQGLLVHALGGVDSAGNGFLCAGPSGAGKTTLARQWLAHGGGQVLSDDRIIVRHSAGQLWIHGTPWHGDEELARPERAPLRRIYFLEPDTDDALLDLGQATAAARLLACCFLPFFSEVDLGACADVAALVAGRVRCQRLRFTPTREAVQCLQRDLSAADEER